MRKLFPPFKVDIAGALCVPFTLRDARNRYQHGQISLSALRAIENKEICKLMERLKLEGIEVVTDGGFRSYDFLEGWEGIRCRDNADSSLEKKLEVTGRIGLLHHPILISILPGDGICCFGNTFSAVFFSRKTKSSRLG